MMNLERYIMSSFLHIYKEGPLWIAFGQLEL